MERDWDLIRKILTEIAKADDVYSIYPSDYENPGDITYHYKILQDAGLIDCKLTYEMAGTCVLITINGLTWEGNEFLENIKNDKVWKKIIKKITKLGYDVSFDVFKQIAVNEAVNLINRIN